MAIAVHQRQIQQVRPGKWAELEEFVKRFNSDAPVSPCFSTGGPAPQARWPSFYASWAADFPESLRNVP